MIMIAQIIYGKLLDTSVFIWFFLISFKKIVIMLTHKISQYMFIFTVKKMMLLSFLKPREALWSIRYVNENELC